jgi:outer membrane protein assembly factor BamA
MNKIFSALFAALLLVSFSPFSAAAPRKAPARKAPASAIRFQGAPQYAQDELLTAAGFKPGARLTTAEIKARARQLNDTGLFSAVKFTSSGRGLVFTLAPTTDLYSPRLDNLPLAPGKDLDDLLHQRLPLYRGQLPASGSIVDQACAALQDALAAKGIKATVKAALTSGLGPKKITALNFSIASPAVKIGPLQLTGVSAAMQGKVASLTAGQAGAPFDTENTAPGLEHAFLDLYQDQGYLAATVSVAQLDLPTVPPTVSTDSIDIPFRITVREGAVYKLGAIRYPADAPVPRAAIDKLLARYPAGSGRPLDLFLAALRDAFHARGYLDCTASAQPVFNEATHTADYTLTIAPGPAYQLAAISFDGAPDAMLPRLQRAWPLAPGAVFDESYASGFAAQAGKKDKALAKWLLTVLVSYDVKTAPDTHQATCIFHFAKTAGGK